MTDCHPWKPMQRFALPSLSWRTFGFPVARVPLSPEARKVQLKCSKGEETRGSLVSDVVDKQVDALLKRKENQVLLDRLEKASQRVENARQQLERVQKEELEAKQLNELVKSLESRASEVAESQREISEARRMIEEAERSLREISEERGGKSGKEEERLESAKAALICGIGGTVAGLPIYLSEGRDVFGLMVPAAAGFISCALFGVTFRYVVRRDVDDVHLKSGAVAAFSIATGLGMLSAGPPLDPTIESFQTHFFDGSLYVAQSFLIFASAALSFDFCLKSRFISPFPKASHPTSTKDF